MQTWQVTFTPEARDDLISLYEWISERAGPRIAIDYINRIEQFCQTLSIAPHRGSAHNHVRDGLRVIGFEKRTNIAFAVRENDVVILRVLHGGQNWSEPDRWD